MKYTSGSAHTCTIWPGDRVVVICHLRGPITKWSPWVMDGHTSTQNPFLHMLSNNALALFIIWHITYSWLSEFAQIYDHLAHVDDLHLHSFSRSDNYVIRASRLAPLVVVFNSCLSHKASYSFEGIQIHWEEKGVTYLSQPPVMPQQRDNRGKGY